MADQEYLNLLTQGVEAWNRWKEDTHEIVPSARGNLCYDADLSEADLRNADLNGVNLGKVNLPGANFAGAHLVGACFIEAELAETNFVGAQLSAADLSGANVCAADFSNADLRNANLSGADLSEACFQGANLSGANLSQADLSEADLSEANLQEANLNEANFSGVYGSSLLGVYLSRKKIRRAKEAGAVMRQAHTERLGAEERTKFSFKRKNQGQNIVLYARPNGRLLRLIGGVLLAVIAGVWMLRSPENPTQVVMGTLTVLFCGLCLVIFLLRFLFLLFSGIPLLVVNDKGIQYFYPSMFEKIVQTPMTRRNIMLKWDEIGALGLITMEQTSSFAVYASAERWRSGWSPSILLPLSLLPVSAKQLIALLQERYRIQVEAYHIENVEIADMPSPPRQIRKEIQA